MEPEDPKTSTRIPSGASTKSAWPRMTEYYISDEKIRNIALRGMGHAKDLAFCVREVLADPTAIFRGVREEGECKWLCYAGKPRHSYTKEGNTCPPRKDRVFLVFVNDEGIIYHWRWDSSSSDDDALPENYDTRFTKG